MRFMCSFHSVSFMPFAAVLDFFLNVILIISLVKERILYTQSKTERKNFVFLFS